MGTIREIKIDVELGPGGIRKETLLDKTKTEQRCYKEYDDNSSCKPAVTNAETQEIFVQAI